MSPLRFWIMTIPFACNPAAVENHAPEKTMHYPYFASERRATQIRTNYRKIQIGMTVLQVKKILAEPDEILPLYEPMKKNPARVGTTYWYLIERSSDSGSVAERDEKLVRISFDLNGYVTEVEHWGF